MTGLGLIFIFRNPPKRKCKKTIIKFIKLSKNIFKQKCSIIFRVALVRTYSPFTLLKKQVK